MPVTTSNVKLVMGASLFLTNPPEAIDPALVEYLNHMRTQIQQHVAQNFANMQLVAGAINSGTNAGLFTISAGSKITLVNGIVTSVG